MRAGDRRIAFRGSSLLKARATTVSRMKIFMVNVDVSDFGCGKARFINRAEWDWQV